MVEIFKSLDIDKSEWLEDIKHGDCSSASFMACVEECISERESRKFEEGLNTKVKLGMYKCFGKSVEFKKYLHGICDIISYWHVCMVVCLGRAPRCQPPPPGMYIGPSHS